MGVMDLLHPFWQGVLASVVAGILLLVAPKLWSIFSAQSKESQRQRQQRFIDLQSKMQSSDSVVRVEGYFIALFTLLRYLFIAGLLWVLASAFGWFAYLFEMQILALVITCVSLVMMYLGFRYLHAITRTGTQAASTKTPATLIIIDAKYGHGENYFDVTELLRAKILTDQIKVTAGNELAGDPAPGQPKELIVNYTYQGQNRRRVVREHETLSLP